MAIKIKKKSQAVVDMEDLDAPDQFVKTAGASVGWATQNRPQLLAGVLGVVLLGGIIAAGVTYFGDRDAEMSDGLTSAVKVMRAPVGDSPNPDTIATAPGAKPVADGKEVRFDTAGAKYSELATKADEVIAAFPDEPAGQYAKLIKARALHGQGKYAEAAALYQGWLDGHADAPERAFVLQSLATAQAAAGDAEAAVTSLEALKGVSEEAWGETASYQIGRIYETKGDKDKARAAYEGLLAKYPDSARAELVKMHLDFL